jgi:hypothetical protein
MAVTIATFPSLHKSTETAGPQPDVAIPRRRAELTDGIVVGAFRFLVSWLKCARYAIHVHQCKPSLASGDWLSTSVAILVSISSVRHVVGAKTGPYHTHQP